MKDVLFSICKQMGFNVQLMTNGQVNKVFLGKGKVPLFAFILDMEVDHTFEKVCEAAIIFLSEMVLPGEA